MHGEAGQNTRVVVRVAVRLDSSIVPRDHRMCDPESCRRPREKSDTIVAGNNIAQHEGGGRSAGPGGRNDAGIGVVGSRAIDDGDIERSPWRGCTTHEDSRAFHQDSEEIIVHRDFAEDAGDDGQMGGQDFDPGVSIIGSNRIRHEEAARCGGRDNDPVTEIPDDAVFDF
jgi:hypothetical protein